MRRSARGCPRCDGRTRERPPSIFDRMSAFDPQAYWEQRLERSKGLEGVGYIGLGQAFNAWMYRVRRRTFLHVVSRHMPSRVGKAVLDVGSGTGEYLKRWQELSVTSIS